MSETLLKFLLSEVLAVRVVCRHLVRKGQPCGAVTEVQVGDLGRLAKCPLCGNDLFDAVTIGDVKKGLLAALALEKGAVSLEFVLPGRVADEATG